MFSYESIRSLAYTLLIKKGVRDGLKKFFLNTLLFNVSVPNLQNFKFFHPGKGGLNFVLPS